MKRVLLGLSAAFVLASMGCVVEVISEGDPCVAADLGEQHCTGSTWALYCTYDRRTGSGTWVRRNCDAECRSYGYPGGYCEYWGYTDQCVCSGATYSSWTHGGVCTYNGDSFCYDRNTMYYCEGGTIYAYNCMAFCNLHGHYPDDAFCKFDPARATWPDDNCYCDFR